MGMKEEIMSKESIESEVTSQMEQESTTTSEKLLLDPKDLAKHEIMKMEKELNAKKRDFVKTEMKEMEAELEAKAKLLKSFSGSMFSPKQSNSSLGRNESYSRSPT